jgi:hypothetical protein
VSDIVSFQQQNCSRTPYVAPAEQFTYRFVLSQVQGWSTVSLNNSEKLLVESTSEYVFPVGLRITQGSGSVTLSPGNVPNGTQDVEVNFGYGANLCVDAKVNLKVYVNDVFEDERAFHGCAYDGSWTYKINKATGELVRTN